MSELPIFELFHDFVAKSQVKTIESAPRSCKRSDAGTYTVTAVNSVGKDTVTVNLKVIGKPGPPEGPLKAADVTATGCALSWKRPKDDGGAPIEYYQGGKIQ